MRRCLSLLFFLVIALSAWSQQAPPTVVPSPPAGTTTVTSVSEVTKLRLLSAYKSALLAQNAAAEAQQVLQRAVDVYNAATKKAAVDEKLPEGTKFNVDLAKEEVSAQLPAPPASNVPPPSPPVPAADPKVKGKK